MEIIAGPHATQRCRTRRPDRRICNITGEVSQRQAIIRPAEMDFRHLRSGGESRICGDGTHP